MKNSVHQLSLGLLLASASILPSYGQTTPAPTPGRFYVGASFLRSEYIVATHFRTDVRSVRPWQVQVGYQVLPRLAVQVGYSARFSETKRAFGSYGYDPVTGEPDYGSLQTTRRLQVLPVLVRYTALREQHTGLQLDIVAGGSLLFAKDDLNFRREEGGQVVKEINDRDPTTQRYATAGLGLRYPLGKHFEGVLDWTYSYNERSLPDEYRKELVGNKWGLTRAVGLGLNYRFNVQKKS